MYCVVAHIDTLTLMYHTGHVNNIITESSVENKIVVIMGDITINLLNYETSPSVNKYIDCVFYNHLQPAILRPSRITNNSSTLIDNIFTNAIDCKIFSGNMISQISDHLPHIQQKSQTILSTLIFLINIIISTKNVSQLIILQ